MKNITCFNCQKQIAEIKIPPLVHLIVNGERVPVETVKVKRLARNIHRQYIPVVVIREEPQ